MKSKLKGNLCTECRKTHEQCVDENTCSKKKTSLYVCVMFGTRRQR